VDIIWPTGAGAPPDPSYHAVPGAIDGPAMLPAPSAPGGDARRHAILSASTGVRVGLSHWRRRAGNELWGRGRRRGPWGRRRGPWGRGGRPWGGGRGRAGGRRWWRRAHGWRRGAGGGRGRRGAGGRRCSTPALQIAVDPSAEEGDAHVYAGQPRPCAAVAPAGDADLGVERWVASGRGQHQGTTAVALAAAAQACGVRGATVSAIFGVC
jgi:hypothetical protein